MTSQAITPGDTEAGSAQPAEGAAKVNWWEVDGDKYDDSITRAPPTPTPQAAQQAPAGSAGLFIDGVNIERLVEALTFLGRRTDGQEAMAANLSEYINAVTRAVLACKELLRPSPQAADTGAVVPDLQRLHDLLYKAQLQTTTDVYHSAITAARIELSNIRATAPQPAPPADSVLEDAARWQMVVLVGNEVMLHPEKRSYAAAVAAYMDAVHRGLDLTGAIDSARKQGGA